MGSKMKQCNFCSRTLENPKVNTLYKGILNAHICDYCLKDALKNIIKLYPVNGKLSFFDVDWEDE